jgi:hypothetical protein
MEAVLNKLIKFWVPVVLVAGFATFFTSCDEDEVFPPPSVSLSSSASSNPPGQKVTTSVTVESPAGGQSLNILVNGATDANLPAQDLGGEVSVTRDIEFTIPASATIGATYLITFQATDVKGQKSDVVFFTVTVSQTPNKPIVEITGSITANTTWTANNIYKLKGFVRVGTDVIASGATSPTVTATATLTIEAGTVIIGERASKGTLIIQRGSKLIANGTALAPIVFTSERASSLREPGDWGGIVICGLAPNNISGTLGAGIAELEGQYGAYHGGGANASATDNSGELTYVRIEYAGVPINPNQEVNSLTLGSVGSGTKIEYVQCAYGLDDSFEWFGGTVNAKWLIAYRGVDDDWDVDNGYSGSVQFGLSIKDKDLADQSGSNGFEVDNDGSGSANTPFTSAVFSNMTVIGPKANRETAISLQFQSGAQLRRGNKIKIINSFFTAFPNGIFLDDNGTVKVSANAAAGDLVLKTNVVAGVEHWGGNGFGSAGTIFTGLPSNGANHPTAPRGFRIGAGTATFSNGVYALTPVQVGGLEAEDWFDNTNTLVAKWQDAGISATIFEAGAKPTLLPAAGSILLSGGDATGYSALTAVTHRGAFGTTDWTNGWVNWNPQSTDYSK